MRITVVEVNSIIDYPPVVTLVRLLVSQGHEVNLISRDIGELVDKYELRNVNCIELKFCDDSEGVLRVINKIELAIYAKIYVKRMMRHSDILWTTSANTIKVLGRNVIKYNNILQLMELVENLYLFHGLIRIPIKDIAKKSWKTVVPEINRAFIEQAWWDLKELPYVLPNKPFDLDYGELSSEARVAIEKMENDARKKIIYLGGIWPDRDLEVFAKAIRYMSDFALYIVGKPYGTGKKHLDELINKYDVVYLGGFSAPQHLAFLKCARIGLLPYKPSKNHDVSVLNALYCAPNKIYEYAGYGIPMIGSYVPGLIVPFEQYNIGYCYKDDEQEKLETIIRRIDDNYESMSKNCKSFYDDIDLGNIVRDILESSE